MKKAFLIGHINIKNQEKWINYKSKVPQTLELFNAKVIARGKLNSVLTGHHTSDDIVILEFEKLEDIEKWYSSEEYKKLIPIRSEAAEMTLLAYEES